MRIYFLAILGSLAVCGCASTQLNHNTLDLASSTDDLLTKQVLHNLADFIDSKIAIPTQLTVSSGTATTTNTITPSLTSPLSQTVQTTNMVAAVVTNTRAATTNPFGLTVSASNVSGQNWAYETITDSERMLRLRALYRYAVDWSDEGRVGDAKFVDAFPLIRKSVSHIQPECTYGRDFNTGAPETPVLTNTAPAWNPRSKTLESKTLVFCATSAASSGNYTHGPSTSTFSTQREDEQYLQEPICIVCGIGKPRHINPHLAGRWLRWRDLTGAAVRVDRQPRPGDLSLGYAGHYELFVDQNDTDKFVNFTIAVLAASTQSQSTATGTGGGGGNQSQAATKPNTPYELTLPIQ